MSAIRRGLATHRAEPRDSGQALVEFSLAIMVFLVMVLALFDLGRGVYMYNGVSEAAREIARVTAVHPGVTLGAGTETADRIAVQRALVPGLGTPSFECVTVTGAASTNDPCTSDDYVRVTIGATYTPISPLGLGGPITLTASSAVRLP